MTVSLVKQKIPCYAKEIYVYAKNELSQLIGKKIIGS